jgi:16S rRNA (guanine966-N2)-methyltransferase
MRATRGSNSGPRHQVRIIGGQWKRTKLPVSERPGLRPSPDRVRETLFNWLGQDLSGWRCIDAFAGSGALGLEAASRGAGAVLLIEQDPALVAQLRAVLARLGASRVEVQCGDALAELLRQPRGQTDLVLLDPPFDAALHEPALRASLPLLSATGRLYLEAPRAWADPALAALGLVRLRYLKAGAVHAHLLQRAS